MNKIFYIELILLIVLGALTSLSLPPLNYFLINFFTLSSLFIFLLKKSNQHKNKKLFFLYGWMFGFGYFITNLYWISISLTFDLNFKFLIPFTVLLIPAFLAVFYGLSTYLFFILKPKTILSSFFIFSLFFGLLEFIRGTVLSGFPWNLIASSFSNQLEILAIISVIGTYGFNLFCISLFISPSLLIMREKTNDLIVCALFLISLIFFYLFGSNYKERFYNAEKKENDYKLRVIGSNVSLERFYYNIDTTSILRDLIKISDPVLKEKTIFVWPEGIVPDIYQKDLIKYNSIFRERFDENHLFIIGINSIKVRNGSQDHFNSLSVYDNELNLLSSYNKIKLVPFGEFLPLEKLFKNLGLKSLTNNYQSYSKGDERKIIEIKRQNFSLKFLPLICYEIIYSGKLFQNSDFDLIMNISEDGWFGQSIGPKQHFAHSTFRAIESGKYIVRSSNNGIAAIINPLGHAEQTVNLGLSGYIDLKETKKIQPTIFSKYGNKIFGLLILLYIFLTFSFNRIKNE